MGAKRRQGEQAAPMQPRRVLPYSMAAEEQVLGALLFSGKAIAKVGDALKPGHFYDRRHEAIYDAMLELDTASRPIDILTVAEAMVRRGTMGYLAASGSEAYLAELANKIGTTDNIAAHAAIVRDKARSRALILELSEAVEEGYGQQYEADELFSRTMQRLLGADQGSPQGYVHRRRLLHSHLQGLEQRYTDGGAVVTGIPTGILKFDLMTRGLQPGEFTVIGGRPSMGKTSLVMGWVEHAAGSHGSPCLVFSLEMTSNSLLDRSVAAVSGVEGQRISTGRLETKHWRAVTRAYATMYDAPIAIDAREAPTLAELRAVCKRWRCDPEFFPAKAREGEAPRRGLIVIDYLQLMRGGQKARDEGAREREISEISRGLKSLAKELDVAVVALSQLNRGCEARADKRPMTSDLRESGAIEQDGDLIVFVYRDEVYKKETADLGIAELIVGKQRNGPTGTVRVRFDNDLTRFDNLDEERSEDEAPPPRRPAASARREQPTRH